MKENEDVINDPSSTDADVYMAMLKETFDIAFVADAIKNQDDIRRWWMREKPRREKYGLSPEQEQQIIDMCRVAVTLLPPTEQITRERQPYDRNRNQHQRRRR